MKYFFPGLEKDQIKQGISNREDGNMSFLWSDDPKEALKNRINFLDKYNIRLEDCIVMRTTNSTKVQTVFREDLGKGTNGIEDAVFADALITQDKGLVLFLVVADCSSTIFYDPKKEVIALAHLNWKNPDIIREVINVFRANFGSQSKDIKVSIGPSIQKESFKFLDPIQKQRPDWKPYLEDLPDKETSIDMVGYLEDKIIKSGVSKQNIFISPVDTCQSEDLFSHYRAIRGDEREGRFATFVSLRS